EIKGDMDSSLYGDKNWIAEALINIIKNAAEHGGEDITITLEESPIFTTIVIQDNGEGIDPQHLPHIFERFYKTTSKVKPDSIGIGLNLAKLIVEAQKGSISVQSKKDIGTSFTMTFLKGII
ncbi:MAG TPA: sensor histidine kinase, partial [Clostridia bacterium]|nr:sensor histidine kinase [Clostridia bacterium]